MMKSGMLQQLMSNFRGAAAAPRAQPQGFFARPQMPPQGGSIFDMLRVPQQAQFNVQAAQGTKPKKYRPTQISMSNVPVAAVFGLPSANQLPDNVFNVTQASGTKPKNYRPTQISMNAPSPAGPAAMQQMLALMGGGLRATPFAPFGQGQG